MYTYNAFIYDVYDGDTFKAIVDVGFNVSLKETFRLWGVDTPEKRLDTYEEGIRVRDLVRELILNKNLIIHTFKNKEKYGRWLAKVTLEDGSDLGSYLLESNNAVSYFGGKKNS